MRVFDIYEYARSFYIVREFCNGKLIPQLTQWQAGFDGSKKDEFVVCSVVAQILSAIRYMHDQNCIHGNLRPEHIIFEAPESSTIKLVDFGWAQYLTDTKQSKRRQHFRDNKCAAPETLEGKYTEKSDLWTIGVLAYKLMSGKFPFEQEYQIFGDEGFQIKVDFTGGVWKSVSEECKDFIQSLLQRDPSYRLNAHQAQKHAWIKADKHFMNKNISKGLVKRVIKHLHKSVNEPALKKGALCLIAHNTSPEKSIQDIREVFCFLDKLGAGIISFKEFAKKLVHCDLGDEEALKIFQSVDLHNDGYVQYTEFVGAVLEYFSPISLTSLQDAYNQIDKLNGGYICTTDVMSAFGIPFNQAEKMIRKVDLDRDGKVSYNEFLEMFSHDGAGRAEKSKNKAKNRRRKSNDDVPLFETENDPEMDKRGHLQKAKSDNAKDLRCDDDDLRVFDERKAKRDNIRRSQSDTSGISHVSRSEFELAGAFANLNDEVPVEKEKRTQQKQRSRSSDESEEKMNTRQKMRSRRKNRSLSSDDLYLDSDMAYTRRKLRKERRSPAKSDNECSEEGTPLNENENAARKPRRRNRSRDKTKHRVSCESSGEKKSRAKPKDRTRSKLTDGTDFEGKQ